MILSIITIKETCIGNQLLALLGVVEPLPAALVRPDTTYKYDWVVPKGGGPTENDPDCINYLYYSAVDPIRDTNSGLVGPLLICKPKTLKSGKQVSTKFLLTDRQLHNVPGWTFNCSFFRQKNVNKEFYLLATNFDENLSWYLDENINRYTKQPKTVKKDDEDFQLSNKMHCEYSVQIGSVQGCMSLKLSYFKFFI